jgi:hypothetical protein
MEVYLQGKKKRERETPSEVKNVWFREKLHMSVVKKHTHRDFEGQSGASATSATPQRR